MKKSVVWDWVKTIGYPVIIALIIIQFIRPTIIREHSMVPSIDENDYVIVNKMAYKMGEPHYKDVVVFKSSLLDEKGKEKYLIKRVIGAPGDTVEVLDGKVYRNGEVLEEDYINGDFTPVNTGKVTVGNEELFLMGDNRPSSVDSRDPSVGLVEMDRVMGKVFVRLFPFDKIGLIK